MDLSEITGLATSLAGPTSAVAAVANLGDKVLSIGETVALSLVKTNDQKLHEDLQTAAAIINAPDSINRGLQFVQFTDRVLLDGDEPTVDGGPNDTVIGVGRARLLALISRALKANYSDKTINALVAKAAK